MAAGCRITTNITENTLDFDFDLMVYCRAASGVAIVLSARVAKAVLVRPREFGCVGSHIVWVVINTATVPLVMIGVYVPHFGRHLSKHPIDARTVFDQLNKLLGSFPSSWIRVVQKSMVL